MDRRHLLAALPAAALAAGGAWWFSRGTSPASTPIPAASAQTTADDIDTSGIVEMALGDENAPVTVIEYASFTCPHCANFHRNVFGDLKKNYIDTGKVRFIYREVYFDRFGLWAGMVARCGGPERYFGLTDLIYERQRDWLSGEDASQIVQNLRKLGKLAGIGDAELDACLADKEKAQALVALYEKNTTADNIDSTPSFVIDGKKYSNMSYEEFAATIDGKLGG